MIIWVILLVLVFGLVFSGAWLGVALGGTGMVLLYFYGGGWSALSLMASSTWNMLTSFTLVAVPLYIILGQVILNTRLSERLYGSLTPLFSHFPGGLLHTNVMFCAIFGAVSGASNSCLAAIGPIAYPELTKKGYRKDICAASIAGSSTLALIIPPSITLILIGAWQDVSIGELFIAVVIPGLLTTLMFLGYTAVSSLLRKGTVPVIKKEEKMPFLKALWHTRGAWPVMIIIMAVLVTVYIGLATATEAAGLGILATIILAVIFRTFSWKALGQSLYESANMWGSIGLVFFGAVILSMSVSILGLPRDLVMMIQSSGLPTVVILVLVYILYVLLGMLFDPISFLVMTLPFSFPLMLSLGYDPLWFGVMMVLFSMIGMITPPVGMLLFMMVPISRGEVSFGEVAREALPFILMLFVTLILITVFPKLCLWLPSMMK